MQEQCILRMFVVYSCICLWLLAVASADHPYLVSFGPQPIILLHDRDSIIFGLIFYHDSQCSLCNTSMSVLVLMLCFALADFPNV